MKAESGRSLIEIIGVMAIAGVMTAGAITMYGAIRRNQIRTIASTELEQIASDVKILMGMRGTYDGVSVDYLIKAGALRNANAPIGSNAWSVTSDGNGDSFEINLVDLNEGDCAYFATTQPKWATRIRVNGLDGEDAMQCFSTSTNRVSFIVK